MPTKLSMENTADVKINRFRKKIESLQGDSRENLTKHFDAVIKFLRKHPEEFQKFRPNLSRNKFKNEIKIENSAGQKINRFRKKISKQEYLLKHFDAMIRFLHRHSEEFQQYQPQQLVFPPEQTPAPAIPATVEAPRKIKKVETILDDRTEYNDIRNRNYNDFASKHLMRIGTDKFRHSLIIDHINGEFQVMTVTDFDDIRFQKLFHSMNEKAQTRAELMFYKGFYETKKHKESFPIFTNGLILSIDHKLQLKITKPGAKEVKNILAINICSFNIEELVKDQNGNYHHWDSHKKPQVTCQKSQRSALKSLNKNSTVRIHTSGPSAN